MGANDQYVCVLCGEDYSGWGHNPEPIVDYENGRCCDDCNSTKVIPTRIARMLGHNN